MQIIIDIRERELCKLLPTLSENYTISVNITTQQLPLGDAIIADDTGKELLLIERKSLRDLAASIKDGRYEEQSYRLNNHPLHNHNIVYLIEGDLKTYSTRYTRLPKKTLYSAMFAVNYYKGFSLVRTMNVLETAEYILRAASKLTRARDVLGYYNGGDKREDKHYSDVVKKARKQNITPDNIGVIVLSQIPGISSITARAIMQQYSSLYTLLQSVQKNRHCLDDVYYETKTGKKRHLSKTAIDNITKYLLCQQDPVINIKI